MQYPFNAKKFITLVPVYEMKYLLKCQCWNSQFGNFRNGTVVSKDSFAGITLQQVYL